MVSHNGKDFVEMQDGSGAVYSIDVSGGKYIPLDPNAFCGINKVKIKTGSAELANRMFILSVRGIE